MSADAARLGEHVGSRTGIVVRSAKKYLSRSGIELVPAATLDRPQGFTIYYRGTEIARLDAAKCRTSGALVAAIYNSVAWTLHTAAQEEE